jgi:predicted metal-dependent hydrolase
MSESPLSPADLLPGAERFNQGDYFEAHEEWEKAWYGREGEEGRFLKGLIQVAVSLYHLESGNLVGARKVMGTALDYLQEFPARRTGVDLEHLRQQIVPLYRELEAGGDPYPRIESAAPQLILTLG